MYLKISNDKLKNAITIAKEALSKVIIQEERSHLLFILANNILTITGTNSDLKAKCLVDVVAFDEEFSFTADPKILEKLLSKIDTAEIKIEFDKDNLTIKVFTSEDDNSFTSLQSFPVDKMLTFEVPNQEDQTLVVVDKNLLIYVLKWSLNFMSPIKETVKKYDFVIINDNIAYSANGSNKMGYLVSKAFKSFNNVKIRKVVIPYLVNILNSIPDDRVNMIDTQNNLGIESLNGSVYYGFLKSSVETPKIKTDYVKSEGKHTLIDKSKMIKVLDRLVATLSSTIGAGIQIDLKGSGDDSYVDFSLVSNLKIRERFKCKRVEEDSSEDVSHVVEYRHFKSILSSIDAKEDVRLYINGNEKFFKVFKVGDFNGEKYIAVGVGSYFKVVPQ